MTILDQAVTQLCGVSIADIAEQTGLTEPQAESALAALGRSAPEPEDTATAAADRAELPEDKVRAVLDAIGGEDGLARLTGALSQGGGLAAAKSGLFGKA